MKHSGVEHRNEPGSVTAREFWLRVSLTVGAMVLVGSLLGRAVGLPTPLIVYFVGIALALLGLSIARQRLRPIQHGISMTPQRAIVFFAVMPAFLALVGIIMYLLGFRLAIVYVLLMLFLVARAVYDLYFDRPSASGKSPQG